MGTATASLYPVGGEIIDLTSEYGEPGTNGTFTRTAYVSRAAYGREPIISTSSSLGAARSDVREGPPQKKQKVTPSTAAPTTSPAFRDPTWRSTTPGNRAQRAEPSNVPVRVPSNGISIPTVVPQPLARAYTGTDKASAHLNAFALNSPVTSLSLLGQAARSGAVSGPFETPITVPQNHDAAHQAASDPPSRRPTNLGDLGELAYVSSGPQLGTFYDWNPAPRQTASSSSAPPTAPTPPLYRPVNHAPGPTTPQRRRRRGLDEETPIRAPPPTSPYNYRSRAHALAWRTQREDAGEGVLETDKKKRPSAPIDSPPASHRPYIGAAERAQLARALPTLLRSSSPTFGPAVLHVDFNLAELDALNRLARQVLQYPADRVWKSPNKSLAKIAKKSKSGRKLAKAICESEDFSTSALEGRQSQDILNYLADVVSKGVAGKSQILALKSDGLDTHGSFVRGGRVTSLLYAREASGMIAGFGSSTRQLTNFTNEFRKSRDDDLELRAEWTNCAGDIITIAWVSNDAFICGTTEHSDSRHQQYNKPGNLALGSCSHGTLRGYPDHRVVRPMVEEGVNSTDAMRRSQDPWLYSSVVSSHYDPVHNRAYTSSFDGTVKVWKAEPDGTDMRCVGTWKHDGNVNFVVANKHESDMVATAADVPSAAVRIYKLDEERDLSSCTYTPYSCSRILDLEGNPVVSERWAYFPATMQWGASEEVQHLLLVGYSPRSLNADENDIPEDRQDSGEICMWDGLTGQSVKINSASTRNVFEVAWHPSQPSFIAATSKMQHLHDHSTRTQIRIFRPTLDPDLGYFFGEIKTLDCEAIDINELTIMPNSYLYSYVTAGCTDGRCYVWDTAQGDQPIHVLEHGPPHEELLNGPEHRDREDTGVKFMAWGRSLDRFYTGGSDGVVKVWNVRSRKKPLVRDLLEVPAEVSSGMFSPDMSKLVIGDASGRVFLLSVDEEREPAGAFMTLPMSTLPNGRRIRRPRALIPHPEPAPPVLDAEGRPYQQPEEETGRSLARGYIGRNELNVNGDPTIGAVQGQAYSNTGLFRAEAHADNDRTMPLLAAWSRQQQEFKKAHPRRQRFRAARQVERSMAALLLHARNVRLDLNPDSLPVETRAALEHAGVDFDVGDVDYRLPYEDGAATESSDEEASSEDESADDSSEEGEDSGSASDEEHSVAAAEISTAMDEDKDGAEEAEEAEEEDDDDDESDEDEEEESEEDEAESTVEEAEISAAEVDESAEEDEDSVMEDEESAVMDTVHPVFQVHNRPTEIKDSAAQEDYGVGDDSYDGEESEDEEDSDDAELVDSDLQVTWG